MKPIKIILITMLVSLIMLTAACSNSNNKDLEAVEIHFQLMTKKSMQQYDPISLIYMDAAANFNKLNKDIKIIFDFMPESGKDLFRSQDIVQILSGDEPLDIVPWSDMSELPTVGRDNLLVDLQPYMSSGLDINQNILDQMMINGKLLSLPYAAYPNAVTYNKALFDAANIPYPEGDWTWEELRDISRLINPSGPVLTYDPFTLALLMAGEDHGLLSPNGDTTVGFLDSPESVRTVQWLNAYYHDGQSSPAIISGMDMYGLFDSRQVGMLVGGTGSTFSSFAGANKDLIGYAPLPHFAGSKRANPIRFQGFGISAKSEYPEEAWKFIQYLTLTNNEDSTKLASQFVSTSKSVAEAMGQTVDPIKSMLIDEMNYAASSFGYNTYYNNAWTPELITQFQLLLTTDDEDIYMRLHDLALSVDLEMSQLKDNQNEPISN